MHTVTTKRFTESSPASSGLLSSGTCQANEKDLFRALFERVSGYSFDHYRRSFLERLPHLLLETAFQAAPAIADCRGISELRECFYLASTWEHSWRNAELYPYLNYLAFPSNGKRQSCVNALQAHCRLATLRYDTNPDVHWWRTAKGTQGVEVIRFDGETAMTIPDLVWRYESYGQTINVFRPHTGLFDDVEPRLYGDQSSTKLNVSLDDALASAFSILAQYSPVLCRNILQHISTIALLREVDGRPKSFSLRNRFVGAIFVSVASPVEMAEQIVHEYYHQCMWPWWLVAAPEDLPDVDVLITSPMTGAKRALPTMIQAMLIYASLHDFYDFANGRQLTGPSETVVSRSLARTHLLQARFGDLAATVTSELGSRPASRAIVETIVELREELRLQSRGGVL